MDPAREYLATRSRSSHTDLTRVNTQEHEPAWNDAPKPEGPVSKLEEGLPVTTNALSSHRSPAMRRDTLRERQNTETNISSRASALILPPTEDPTQAAFKQKQNYAHHFFDSCMRPLTWQYIKAMLTSTILLILLMWATLPLYWGSLAPGQRHAPSFRVWVIDLDGGEMGSFVTESVINSTMDGTKHHLGWKAMPSMPLDEITGEIIEEHAWAAIVINEGATNALQTARVTGDGRYEPTSAVTFYINEARNNNAASQIITPLSTELLDNSKTMRGFNARNIAEYVRSVSTNATAIDAASRSAALSGAWWRTENLRPWDAPVATAMTVVGQIYITVFCFVLSMASFPVRGILEPYLKNRSAMLLRVLFPAIAYLPLSLSYAMVSLPFHAPFGGKYTYGGGFFVYVAFVYMNMLALGLALEAAVTILQPRFMPYFLVCWLIVNVSTPVDPHEMQVWWYKYGFAMPFFNHGQATTTILFNTKNVLGRNAGVLIAWTALSVCTTAGFTWLQRHEKVSQYRAGIISRIASRAP